MDDLNAGVIEIAPSYTAWMSSSDSGIIYADNNVLWHDFPAVNKLQARFFETFKCVTASGHYNLAVYGNWKVKNNLYSKENIQWLKDNGYFDDSGSLDFSEQFNVILNGTTRSGNWQEKVAEDRRSISGLIPNRDLPDVGSTYEDYMNPSHITPAMLIKGKEFLKRFKLPYEFCLIKGYGQNVVETLTYHCKQAPIQVTSPVCPGWTGNVKVATCPSITPQHATSTMGVLSFFDEHDQYNPFFKQLALDYPMLYGLKQLMEEIPPIAPPAPSPHYQFKFPLRQGDTGKDVVELQKILVAQKCLDADLLKVSINTGGIFGPATYRAVIKFQNLHADKILAPVGLHNGTGFVGASTIAFLNSL